MSSPSAQGHKHINQPRQDWRWPLLWALAVLAAVMLVAELTRRTTERQLLDGADATARAFAAALVATVPQLERTLADGVVDADTLQRLRALRPLADVFRFRLFATDTRLLLASEQIEAVRLDANGQARLGAGPSPHRVPIVAEALVEGRRTFVHLKDGRHRSDRPALYSEAFVPIEIGGRRAGVVAVYVDQTARQGAVRAAFSGVGGAVAVLVLGLGALGAWQWWRRLQAQRRAEEHVHFLARHDVLTGALNRASFGEVLEQATWRAAQQPEARFAVLCLDLDHFKQVNDSLGHAAGDAVLREATQRLRAVLRQGDEMARLGGDEFAVLQTGVHQPAEVMVLAERIVAALRQPYVYEGRELHCGVSIGAALADAPVADGVSKSSAPLDQIPETLMVKADLALYRAKAMGRGTCCLYDPVLDRQMQRRQDEVRELRRAIADNALQLHYQPVFAADGRTPLGQQALLRWPHARRGLLLAPEFLPLAESAGLLGELDAWVLRRACADAAGWVEPLVVSVNLSKARFADGQLVDTVRGALTAAGLSPQRLELEINEALLMSDTHNVVQALHALGTLGVRVAMNDFGTGYSSLAYLWRYPFDKIKIDPALTQDLQANPKVALVVRSIVSLAHALNMRVNAEGIDSAEQFEALRAEGLDELQGHWLARPVCATG